MIVVYILKQQFPLWQQLQSQFEPNFKSWHFKTMFMNEQSFTYTFGQNSRFIIGDFIATSQAINSFYILIVSCFLSTPSTVKAVYWH